jgi:5'-phosphate synthase pdxT subunit
MRVGILALQGAFAEHAAMLDRFGAEHFEIRQLRDLEGGMDGLILPGGESTTMGKLLRELDLFEPLRGRIAGGLPVFGTCAGLILLAREVEGGAPCFATMDIAVRRNAYGRQLGSFYTAEQFQGVGRVPMTFIRAPYIQSVSGDAVALAAVDGRMVAARQGNQLVTAFHPELDEDGAIHRYFLDMIKPQ